MFREIITYAVEKDLIEERDRNYAANQLAGILETESSAPVDSDNIDDLLKPLLEDAAARGIIPSAHPDYADLLDSEIMGVFCDRPSNIQRKFYSFPTTRDSTDWFYQYNIDVNYIRMNRIKKNIKWQYLSKYGDLDITINLSKPEKDPLAIASQRHHVSSDYPKCLLCKENEGYFGHSSHPARQNLRLIEVPLNGEAWYLQYSPYIYYNQHSILLSAEHRDMVINANAFRNFLAFLDIFPHYFIGSNADLPIVGGSILSHDHYQAGMHEFPLNRARSLYTYERDGIKYDILDWGMNTIKLSSTDKDKLVSEADSLLKYWRGYSNPPLEIFSHSGDTPHNTITPIARKSCDIYELYLCLRNNFTNDKYPLGIYHPHPEYHHLKKENIGLIEVLGLAILPGRLKNQLETMRNYLLNGIYSEDLAPHKVWLDELKAKYTFTSENTDQILKDEIGQVYCNILDNCGVFKDSGDLKVFFESWLNQGE